ncbi:unnamed protein product [Scytosiphon promiscuus]
MAPRRPAVQEAQVLALVETVSSVVLYNVRATVGRPDMTSLSMAVDAVASLEALSVSPLLSAEEGGNGGSPPREGGEGLVNRPSLIWLLQQSSLKMGDDKGEPQSAAAAYVNAVLGDWGEGTVKDVLNSFFVGMDAALLPFPVNEVDRLQDLDTVPYSELSDTYKDGISKAVDLIVPACASKEIGGQAMDGPALVSFLGRLTRVMEIPVITEGDDHPAAFLEGLEAKEVELFASAYKADWEKFREEDMPATAEDLIAKHDAFMERATQTASPRSVGKGGAEDGAQETNDAASERTPSSRRPGFVHAFTSALEELYREYCTINAWLWSDYEVSEARRELDKLVAQPASEQPEDNGDAGENEGSEHADGGGDDSPPATLPEYGAITRVFHTRETRWRDEIVPDILRSHPDMAGLVFLDTLEEEGERKDGQLTFSHVGALVSTVDTFLETNLDAARKQARAVFDDRLDECREELKMLPSPPPLEDVETLSSRVKTAALEATQTIRLAVGDDKADEVAAAEGWEKEAASAGEEWVRSARLAGTGAEGKTPGETNGDGPSAGNSGDGQGGGRGGEGDSSVDGVDGSNVAGVDAAAAAVEPDAAAEAEKAEAASAEKAVRLARSILDDYHAPCLAEVTASDPKGRKAMNKCAAVAEAQWDLAESARPEELEGRKSTALEPAMKEREAEHVEWAIQEAFQKATARFNKEALDMQLPTADENIERLLADSKRHLVKMSSPKMDGGLLSGKDAQRKLEVLVREVYEEFKSRNNEEWKRACLTAKDAYAQQVSRATSFFSLAPLRFSGAPPFEPARCLTTGVVAEKITRSHVRLRAAYQRGTWGRRWVVRLALWAGFVLAMTAVALLAAGRQLQHRPMAIAFLAAAAFHLIVLLLCVSEGLALGTRPWLLASAAVLAYVASGSTLGGKRGRRGASGRRPIWSGRTVMGGYSNGSSSLMPLFRGHGVGTGRGVGKGGAGSWGGRHKE